MQNGKKIWMITGISSGLGKALTEAVIKKGDFVIGTFRHPEQVNAFNAIHTHTAFALQMDIANATEIQKAFQIIQKRFGKLDVLVNNAGFGFAGAIEETSIAEVRKVFETNFFGSLQVTQAALPVFRHQKSGHIFQISSQAGIRATAGFGIYNATKFALEGFSEALAAEIAPLGIKLTIVEPGPFRTNFAGSSFQQAVRMIDDYRTTTGIFRERMSQIHGKQEGNPDKAAAAIVQMAASTTPPLRLPLGRLAIEAIRMKIESIQRDVNTYKELAESVVF